MTFGSKVRLLRNIKGYSQQYVAHMLNLSENSFRKIENDTVIPKLERKQQIAKILGISIEDLEAMGEGNAIFYSSVQCETGGFVGSNGVVHNNNPKELIIEIDKLKIQLHAKDQRITDLEKHLKNLEMVVELLKAKIG